MRNLGLMNKYYNGSMFSIILHSLESSYIIDLQKFFEKRPDSVQLINIKKGCLFDDSFLLEEDKNQISSLLEDVQLNQNIEELRILRNKFVAHEAEDLPKNMKIYCRKMEGIFSLVQDILGIVAKRSTKEFIVWDMAVQDTQSSLTTLMSDLERGAKERVKEM